MNLEAAIRAAAPIAPQAALDGMTAAEPELTKLGALKNDFRAANLIGQCAHESTQFTRVQESLYYTTESRLMAIFGRYFRTGPKASDYLRNSEKLANLVYANRMGNGPPASGDGYHYRGRGYIQLTGRSNYASFGRKIGIDLIANPDLATKPQTAWSIAAAYLAGRKRAGKTAFQWADEDNVEMVTRIVNGGTNGLADRRDRTSLALKALGDAAAETALPTLEVGAEGRDVELLQRALHIKGYSPGAIDGDFGPATKSALVAFQKASGLPVDGIAGPEVWNALGPLHA